ncbi:MAG: alpha-hydroxy-acid oxidizing protein, partial [Rhodococcus sp. (in: high G+C Gram-positive bacteria)]
MTEARPSNFSDHQLGIYAAGMFAQQTPSITTNLARLEDQAAEKLSPEALGYIVASAGSGSTARANRAAFDRWAIAPRMLRSSAARDHACT